MLKTYFEAQIICECDSGKNLLIKLKLIRYPQEIYYATKKAFLGEIL